MSKGSLFWGNAVGKLGESVFYRANGQQRNRTYLREIKNPKTRAQMTNRVKWANVINTWRLLKPFIAMGMQNRPTKQSDYNAFVSMNVRMSSAYLLKDEAKQNGSLLAPYFVTSGTLGNRSMVSAAETGISTGEFTLETGSIGELSAAIISQNVGFAIGDQVTVIVVGQTLGEGGVPVVIPAAFKFVLQPASASDIAIDVIEVTGGVAPTISNGHLAWEFAGSEYSDYGAAVIQSRIDAEGQLLLSTSRILVEFQTPGTGQSYNPFGVSLDEALNSYGYNPAAYLSPASAGAGSSGTVPRVTGVTVGGSELVEGETLQKTANASQTIQITGSNLVPGAVTVKYDGETVALTVASDTLITASITIKQNTKPIVVTWPDGSISANINGSVL